MRFIRNLFRTRAACPLCHDDPRAGRALAIIREQRACEARLMQMEREASAIAGTTPSGHDQ